MEKIKQSLERYWGYGDFLPLQREAMHSISSGRDSIVVLPTGGGKSLCYQAPVLSMDGMAVVVSPLISLMKDQVDALVDCGVAAMRLDSSLSGAEQDMVLGRMQEQSIKILYLSPERLLSDGFIDLLGKTKLSYIAIDEAHCVSMWGHDFRPEYRQLGILKQAFGGVTVGAYTATATEQVRKDIAQQLKLIDPLILVGSFDRPNLIYKIEPRKNMIKQVCEVLERHKNQSGVVYCIRRKDVDELCGQLQAKGYRARPYHAGMSDQARRDGQDDFINERVDIIVATIAFGMGIDKSNVRFVIHAGMPKSLENYQQESGRAGRDGLEAHCTMFYSGSDYGVWKSLMRDMPENAQQVAVGKLNSLYRFCTGSVCRHRAILQYFGQSATRDNCQACDVCLGELECVDDALITAQKILSCIIRLDQRFGTAYTGSVLVGSNESRIVENGHNKLSTYGLLKQYEKSVVLDWIEQLVGQGYIEKTGEYNVLGVTQSGWAVLKGKGTVRLLKPAMKAAKKSKVAAASWEGVDEELFEVLRKLRAKIAGEKHLPAYIVFGDAALRDMARRRPSNLEEFLLVSGVGRQKCDKYGEEFVGAILAHSRG
ncbi:MAG: ATP-dependent DNA helicase RecQ [Planctomycetes bacterium GWF2_50_10]|nr:MAG: ATP-dependent DNA helicase RecQ [Planctomycetes bacterium GWF2_50_10]